MEKQEGTKMRRIQESVAQAPREEVSESAVDARQRQNVVNFKSLKLQAGSKIENSGTYRSHARG